MAGRTDRAGLLAAWYDLDLREPQGDLHLYLALADREPGPILELAAGTGRVAVPLACAGHQVTAVDHDPAMLARAAARWRAARRAGGIRKGGALTLVEADLLQVALRARFGLAILALNSVLLLGSYERQAEGVAVLARHLRPGGLAVVDAWLPAADELAAYDGRVGLEWVRDEPGERRVAKFASARHDAATAAVELTTIYDSWPARGGPVTRLERIDRLRLVAAEELAAMAAAAGLSVERLAGDYDLTPLGPGAERVLLLGRLV